METIILASGSPRRQELLNRVRIPFKAFPPNIDESFTKIRSVEERVKRITLRKIETVVEMFKQESPRWLLGLDTLVEIDGEAIHKPAGPEEAQSILMRLSGKVHRVYTGIGLLPNKGEKVDLRCVCTEVKLASLSREDIELYLESGEWSGVTGAYRIQERGAFFVEWIRGSYSNVVGLPLETFYGILKSNNYSLR
ncbi:MAG: septum formation protein Maf [Spirochaetaceae bacterium]|nr:MAG: septum formation protein Maf [Spirochaetaceae bacterium]